MKESLDEAANLASLGSPGYMIKHGPDIMSGELREKNTERLAKEAV